MRFEELNLIKPLLETVLEQGYSTPTPIQEKAIPHVLAGLDVMGCAQTGTGKTAAFALPILQRLHAAGTKGGRRTIRTLVLTPTRELASQNNESFETYGRKLGFRTAVIFGGVGQNPQVRALNLGVDILVATPGRLLDLMNQGFVDLHAVEIFVLDEADRMLDMGFIHDIKRVVKALPAKRQTLLFSATLPQGIKELSSGILIDPVYVSVAPSATPVEKIEQTVYFVDKPNKMALLVHLLNEQPITRALVFTRTKHGADKVVNHLAKASIQAAAIHGNKSQSNRERALHSFKRGHSRVLVATDIASRGLDIDDVSHVVNFDLPNEPESYVHRIGRTGRAGANGIAFSFCCSEERGFLSDIERLIRKRLDVTSGHPFGASERPSSVREYPEVFRQQPYRNAGQHRGERPGYGRPGGETRTRSYTSRHR
jgi:ATP-dependent RNA helicase RhlE